MNINYQPNLNPQLSDVLNFHERSVKLSLNCHAIGEIQSFDPEFQTAVVTISYLKTFLQLGTPESTFSGQDVTGATSVTTQAYPTLHDVPVICLGGGLGSLTFPITAGDQCLILFNDRDLSNWFAGSSSSAPATPALHSFSDAIALVGIRNMPNVLTDYSDDSVVLTYGDNSLEIGADSATLTVGDNSLEIGEDSSTLTVGDNTVELTESQAVITLGTTTLKLTTSGKFAVTNPTIELLASIKQLLLDIQSATTNTIFGPQPLIMPTFAADLAKFESFI